MSAIYNGYPYSIPSRAVQPRRPAPMPLDMMVQMLGHQTYVGPDGYVHMNKPLIESLVRQRERAVPPLCRMLVSTNNWLQVLEGLYLGQRLAESKVNNAKMLYSAASRFNNTQDPMLQTYLAGLYRALDEPAAFGPLMKMLIKHAVSPNPQMLPGGYDPMEEVGGTLLQMIANRCPHP